MSVLLFLLGIVVGAGLLWLCMVRLAQTHEGQRQLAEYQAREQLRDLRLDAMRGMSDVVVRRGARPVAGHWPSERPTNLGFTDRDIDAITRTDDVVLDGEVVAENDS